MIVTNYTPDDLKKLPLRAIVALAARCARRVAHLALLTTDGPQREKCRAEVSEAIRATEDFARGLPCPSLGSVIQEISARRANANGDFVRESALAAVVLAAQSASTAEHVLGLRSEPAKANVFEALKADFYPRVADISADLTAQYTFLAASEAFDAVKHDDNFVKAAVADYEKLLSLDLGSFPLEGKPVDLSPTGPLGS